jgi:hypothetical protein
LRGAPFDLLSEEDCIGTLDAIVANVELLVWHVVQDERRHFERAMGLRGDPGADSVSRKFLLDRVVTWLVVAAVVAYVK